MHASQTAKLHENLRTLNSAKCNIYNVHIAILVLDVGVSYNLQRCYKAVQVTWQCSQQSYGTRQNCLHK